LQCVVRLVEGWYERHIEKWRSWLGTAALANNPEMLRGFGLVGNLAADKMDDREEKKRKEAMLAAKDKNPLRL
jgi:hypothetical protein